MTFTFHISFIVSSHIFFVISLIKTIFKKESLCRRAKEFLRIYLITISHLNLFILSKKLSRIYLITISHLNLFTLTKKLPLI